MFKEFPFYLAWTDSMKVDGNFFGLIEYQYKEPLADVNILWVVALNAANESEAEYAADEILLHISDINSDGNVIYSDGVML